MATEQESRRRQRRFAAEGRTRSARVAASLGAMVGGLWSAWGVFGSPVLGKPWAGSAWDEELRFSVGPYFWGGLFGLWPFFCFSFFSVLAWNIIIFGLLV